MSQQFCLKWNNHMNNMMDVFKSLLSTESMVDVTLACDGLSLKAHKMVLSACSPFFQSLFLENPCKHPIVILKDMKYTELKAIIEFMYHGEVNVAQDQLSALMKTAETLRVKGLAEVTNEKNSQSNNSSQDEPSHRSVPRTDTPPPSKRRRGRTRKRSLSDSNRSDEDSNEPKIKQPMSPEIEELSGDVTMDASNSQFSNMQSQVPLQSTPSHSSNTFHKSSSVISQDPQIEEPTSADESEFGVEPAKLLEQTLTTEELNARRRSNVEMQRRPRSSTDHGSIVPTTSMSSDTSNQQPDSPPDIKPELLELDPPMSPVAGPSHSNDNAMMMYMDQSSTSHPGPSGYQDNTALVPQDSQNQGHKVVSKPSSERRVIKTGSKILVPLTLPSGPQLFLINSGVWEQPSEIEIVDEYSLSNSTPEVKIEPEDELKEKILSPSEAMKYEFINSETPLPKFSEMIYDHLQENNLSAVWGTFVDECAKYYFGKYPNIQNSSEYQAIGRKMYEAYPAISYEGKEPWSFFCKSLSQKIRHMKWKIKRKRLGLTARCPIKSKDGPNSLKAHAFKPKVDRRYTPSKLYRALLRELSLGWHNSSITEDRIYEILKATHKGRGTWLATHSHRKVSGLIAECPCFADGKYVVQEFLHHIEKEDSSEMLQRIESLFSAVGAMMEPPLNNSTFMENLQILKYIEEQISFHRGRSSYHFKSVVIHKIDIPDKEIIQHVQSMENSAPLLYIFSDGENIQRAFVAGDKAIINIETTVFYEALLVLIASYYTFSLDYPKTFAQILGIFQTYIVGESYKGIQSNRCTAFIKKLTTDFFLSV